MRVLVLVVIFAALSCAGPRRERPETPAAVVHEVGEDRGAGSVVALQPWLSPWDYQSEEALARALDGWMKLARDRGAFRGDSVVILPEYTGTWLVAAGEGDEVISATTTGDAMTPIALGRFFEWGERKKNTELDDKDTYAIFTLKAERMAAGYERVMSELAARYRVTLVAGSILLPEPRVVDGHIEVNPDGALRNVGFVFGPDGALLGPPAVKAFPTKDELGFLTPADASALPVYDTPAGRVGVLVCADSWYPEAYANLEGVDLLAVPVYVTGEGYWDEPWGGYSGWDAPDDVDAADVGALTEGEAWAKYSYPARAPAAGIPLAVGVPLRGELWDLGDDGPTLVVDEGELREIDEVDGPLITVVWR